MTAPLLPAAELARTGKFIDPVPLTWLLQRIYGVLFFLFALMLIGLVWAYFLVAYPDLFQRDPSAPPAPPTSPTMAILIGIFLIVLAYAPYASLVISGLQALVFLCWVYRLSGNLPGLAYPRQRFSPATGVVLLLIPLVNIVGSLLVVDEIAQASDPKSLSDYGHRARGMNWLVLVWWVLCVWAGALSLWILYAASQPLETQDEILRHQLLIVALNVLSLVVYAVGCWMVGEICANQLVRRHMALNLKTPASRSS